VLSIDEDKGPSDVAGEVLYIVGDPTRIEGELSTPTDE
jgi:hypothetical protein